MGLGDFAEGGGRTRQTEREKESVKGKPGRLDSIAQAYLSLKYFRSTLPMMDRFCLRRVIPAVGLATFMTSSSKPSCSRV